MLRKSGAPQVPCVEKCKRREESDVQQGGAAERRQRRAGGPVHRGNLLQRRQQKENDRRRHRPVQWNAEAQSEEELRFVFFVSGVLLSETNGAERVVRQILFALSFERWLLSCPTAITHSNSPCGHLHSSSRVAVMSRVRVHRNPEPFAWKRYT